MLKKKLHSKYIFLFCIHLTALFIITTGSSFAASLYTITNIEPIKLIDVNGIYDSQNLRIKINANNKVIGWHRNGLSNSSTKIGFSWDIINGFNEPLSLNSEHAFTDNNASDISAGFFIDSNNNQIASIWDATYNTQTVLGTLGGSNSQALGININNQVVGYSENSSGIVQPFSWANGTMSIVPINNELGGTADLVNDNNWIAGSIITGGGIAQGYIWDGIDLNIINAFNSDIAFSWTSGINNLNQVVGGMQIFQDSGSTNFRNNATHAYRWNTTNGLEDLGININGSSWAIATNDNQQVVGGGINNINTRGAILWENGDSFDLNKLVSNIENWTLLDATNINASGNIVGIGKRDGFFQAFLLEPQTTPATVSDLSIALTSVNPNNKPSNKARQLDAEKNQLLNFTITNNGPDDASDVTFESTLDDLLSVSALSISTGLCTIVDNKIDCDIPSLKVNDSINLALTLNAEISNNYQIDAQVNANEIDAGVNLNNSVSKTLKVIPKAVAPVQQTPQPAQDTTGDTTNNKTPTEDKPDATTNAGEKDTAQATSKTSTTAGGGCSIGGKQQIFDPVFYLLVIISVVRVFRVVGCEKQKNLVS